MSLVRQRSYSMPDIPNSSVQKDFTTERQQFYNQYQSRHREHDERAFDWQFEEITRSMKEESPWSSGLNARGPYTVRVVTPSMPTLRRIEVQLYDDGSNTTWIKCPNMGTCRQTHPRSNWHATEGQWNQGETHWTTYSARLKYHENLWRELYP